MAKKGGNGTGWSLDDLNAKGIILNGDKASVPQSFRVPTVKGATAHVTMSRGVVPSPEQMAAFTNMVGLALGSFFIPHNVPSSKNNKGAVPVGDGTKAKVIPNELTEKYRKKVKPYFIQSRDHFKKITAEIPLPLRVEIYFVRSSRRKSDHHNLVQVIADFMQEYGWIPDDDMDNLLIYPPLDGVAYHVDPKNPGVFIKILQPNKK